jgi:glutamine synthetase
LRFHSSAVTDFAQDRAGSPIGYGAEAPEFIALPDLATFNQLPWDPEFATCTCDLYSRPELSNDPGVALPTDSRGILKRATAAFSASTGLSLKSGCEPEMTWLQADKKTPVQARPLPLTAQSSAYHLEDLTVMSSVVKRVSRYAHEMGFDMIEGDYEDPGQLELNFQYADCLLTADRVVLMRQICSQVARELGLVVTFMPKPFVGRMANGCHHNISVWRGDENVLADPERADFHLTELGLHALGGILTHARGMMAIAAPTANSYARFWDQGQFAPASQNWGFDNKTCMVRVPGLGRFEYKPPDSATNPYLMHTLLLAAVRDGIELQLDPGPAATASSYDPASADASQALPGTLADALDAFAADTVLTDALGTETTTIFQALKRDEWARACGAVTQWDRDSYFDILP